MQGASQIKLTAGGGVASPFSPLDVVTFNENELRAAVEATRDKRSKVGDAMIDTFVETLEQISPEGRRRLADGLFR